MKPLSVLAGLTLAAVGWCAGEAAWTIRQARHSELPLVHQTLWNVSQASYNANGAIANVNAMTASGAAVIAKVDVLADKEQVRIEASVKDAAATGRSTRALVDSLRKITDNVWLTTLPGINDTITHLDVNQQRVSDKLVDTLGDLELPLKDLSAATEKLPPLIGHLDQTASNAAEGTKQFAAIATDGRQVADKARETYLKPVNLWYALSKEITHWAFELKGIF